MAPDPVSGASTIPTDNPAVNTSNMSASSSASIWDRISKWVSENKALVYTIAGVAVVVTSAGVVYYLSDTRRSGHEADQAGEKRKSYKAGGLLVDIKELLRVERNFQCVHLDS